jgi:hypothetical protein
MEDKYQKTIDRVLCDPQTRKEFDQIAQGVTPGIDAYRLRKAALKLRKARQLKPELIKRVADWGTSVLTFSAEEMIVKAELIPRLPGIYIFSDKSGYLYIGEAQNLRGRVAKHLDHSDRKAVARYLWDNGVKDLTVEIHAFRADSDGSKASPRKAYEADLIRSRKPRFNVQSMA